MNPSPPLTIIIPTLNEAGHLPALLATLTATREPLTIIISDGGSHDATLLIAQKAGAHLIKGPPGRGLQLQRGIDHAQTIHSTGWFLLLHADTALPPDWLTALHPAFAHPQRAHYGRLRFASADPRARLFEAGVRLRCALFALPYGDQSLLIHQSLLTVIGGIPPLPLMEDVALARRLGRHRLAPLDLLVTTDASAYIRDGWFRRAAQNLTRLAQFTLTHAAPRATPRAASYRR